MDFQGSKSPYRLTLECITKYHGAVTSPYYRSVRVALVLCVMCRGAGLAYAQNGIQQYIWGMSVQKVHSLVSDLTQDPLYQAGAPLPAVQDALLYFDHGKLGPVIPNPLVQRPDLVTSYTSYTLNLAFWFASGRLIGVTFNFQNRNELDGLEHRYGKVEPLAAKSFGWDILTAAWRKPQLLVVWERLPALSTEFVSYLDLSWFKKIEEGLLASR